MHNYLFLSQKEEQAGIKEVLLPSIFTSSKAIFSYSWELKKRQKTVGMCCAI